MGMEQRPQQQRPQQQRPTQQQQQQQAALQEVIDARDECVRLQRGMQLHGRRRQGAWVSAAEAGQHIPGQDAAAQQMCQQARDRGTRAIEAVFGVEGRWHPALAMFDQMVLAGLAGEEPDRILNVLRTVAQAAQPAQPPARAVVAAAPAGAQHVAAGAAAGPEADGLPPLDVAAQRLTADLRQKVIDAVVGPGRTMAERLDAYSAVAPLVLKALLGDPCVEMTRKRAYFIFHAIVDLFPLESEWRLLLDLTSGYAKSLKRL